VSGLLLATDVAARGLDIAGVDHVIHYQVPRTTEVRCGHVLGLGLCCGHVLGLGLCCGHLLGLGLCCGHVLGLGLWCCVSTTSIGTTEVRCAHVLGLGLCCGHVLGL